jgi:hypothetical protein
MRLAAPRLNHCTAPFFGLRTPDGAAGDPVRRLSRRIDHDGPKIGLEGAAFLATNKTIVRFVSCETASH